MGGERSSFDRAQPGGGLGENWARSREGVRRAHGGLQEMGRISCEWRGCGAGKPEWWGVRAYAAASQLRV